MSLMGPLEKGAVRRKLNQNPGLWDHRYYEYDYLDRVIYSELGVNGRIYCRYEYYKDTDKLTRYVKYEDGVITLDNKIEYLDDYNIKAINFSDKCFMIKEFDENKRLIYYKDSTGFECEWSYNNDGSMNTHIINKGEW